MCFSNNNPGDVWQRDALLAEQRSSALGVRRPVENGRCSSGISSIFFANGTIVEGFEVWVGARSKEECVRGGRPEAFFCLYPPPAAIKTRTTMKLVGKNARARHVHQAQPLPTPTTPASTTRKMTARSQRVLSFATAQHSTKLMENVPRARPVHSVTASRNFHAATARGVLETEWHINACLVNMV